jgi:plasmid segregation protein ParM
MKVGIDIGYNATKVMGKGDVSQFASVTGTYERASFSLNGSHDMFITLENGSKWFVGETAVAQSRFAARREDANWIESKEYYRLFLAALATNSKRSSDVQIVTGLPVNYYTKDKNRLANIMTGRHKVKLNNNNWTTFNVTDVRVIPQPFGTLLAVALDGNGRVYDADYATANVGIIDIGGKTTNLLSVNRLKEISKETASINMGAWDLVRHLKAHLRENYPDIDLRDHEIAQVLKQGWLPYFNQEIDIQPIINELIAPIASAIIAEAGQLWGTAARLGSIICTGGGANIVGPFIENHFRHAWTIEEPEYANVTGYNFFAHYLWGNK